MVHFVGSPLARNSTFLGSHFGYFWCPFGTPWLHEAPPRGPRRGPGIEDPILNRFGITFGTPLGTLWDPWLDQVGTKGATALKRGLPRGPLRRTPKKVHFRTPPGEAKVSSRLHGSTVFSFSLGSLLDLFLDPFWEPFGTPWLHEAPPRGPTRGAGIGDPILNRFGLTFGTRLGPLWDPWLAKWAPKGPTALKRGFPRGPPRRTPKKVHCPP